MVLYKKFNILIWNGLAGGYLFSFVFAYFFLISKFMAFETLIKLHLRRSYGWIDAINTANW